MKNSAVCIDFDGTIINVNTFPLWIKFVIKNAWKSKKRLLLFKIVWLLFLRKGVRILSHTVFKRHINSLNYPKSWPDKFFKDLLVHGHINQKVLDQIEKLEASVYVVTTAAPYCYASVIPSFLLFNEHRPMLLCSTIIDGIFVDNYKKIKAKNTLDSLNGLNYVLFTDHIDDLELAKSATSLYLCNPNQKSLSAYDAHGFDYKKIQGS